MSINRNEKKLAASGGVAAVFAVLAFLAGGLGMLLEPIGYIVHNVEWHIDIGLFSGRTWYTYFTGYERHIVTFAMSIVVMIVIVGGAKRKKLGTDIGALVTVTAFLLCVTGHILFFSTSDRGTLNYTWATLLLDNIEQDMKKFDEVLSVFYYVLPIVSAGLMFLSGLIVWVKAGRSSHSIPCGLPDENIILDVDAMRAEQQKETAAETPSVDEKASPVVSVKETPSLAPKTEPEPEPEPFILDDVKVPEPEPEPDVEFIEIPEPVDAPKPAENPKPRQNSGQRKQGGQNRSGQHRSNGSRNNRRRNNSGHNRNNNPNKNNNNKNSDKK